MNTNKLEKILADHKTWLRTNGAEGERADLSDADLSYEDLIYADLRMANLVDANLRGANLRAADLRGAILFGADLREANLSDADLRYADLRYADLLDADLRGSNLLGADLDFSCFPLSCSGGLDVHIDDRQAIQLLYHLLINVDFSKNTSANLKKVLLTNTLFKKANEFHRAKECGVKILEEKENG